MAGDENVVFLVSVFVPFFVVFLLSRLTKAASLAMYCTLS